MSRHFLEKQSIPQDFLFWQNSKDFDHPFKEYEMFNFV